MPPIPFFHLLLTDNAVITKSMQELAVAGVNVEAVSAKFFEENGHALHPDSLVKVSYDAEGEEICFESFDRLSVVVPLVLARGAPNKGGFGGGGGGGG